MQLDQLPRDDSGVVVGSWRLVHRSPDFSQDLGIFAFCDGVTTSPLAERALERAMAGFGSDVHAVPWEDGARPVAAQSSDATSSPPTSASAPTTAEELRALTEEQLREIAGQLGSTDLRWKAQRLRRFIADELGIDEDA